MRRILTIACFLASAGLPPALAAETVADGPRPVAVTQLLATRTTATGQPLKLPGGDVQAIFSEYLIQPGAVLPVHRHPYSRYAYVLEGRLRVARPGHAEMSDYAAGDVVAEMVDEWHFGTNIGEGPLRLLVIDQVPAGLPATELRHD
ncbi:MAG: cupin domain-containing protein [Sneathiellaceae bacterium]